MRARIVAAVAALTLALAAVGAVLAFQGGGAAHATPARGCPAAWARGWQRLADRVQAPVYCPTWMPNPLDAKIGGQYTDIDSVGKDRSYLVSFLEHGDAGSGDVHVNFRGYPGRTAIPRCTTVIPNGQKTVRGMTACFSQPAGTVSSNGIRATIYTVNQDADQWHILLGWHYHHSLYTVSEHVIRPYLYPHQVELNLRKLLAGLVLVRPQG
jgi:hypothetical protein